MPKVLILAGDAAESLEVLYPYQRQREEGCDGMIVSARAWPDHPPWMREFVRILRSHAPAGGA